MKIRVALWDAISRFVASCGGCTSDNSISSARMNAVRDVDRIVDAEVNAIELERDASDARVARYQRALCIAARALNEIENRRCEGQYGACGEADASSNDASCALMEVQQLLSKRNAT